MTSSNTITMPTDFVKKFGKPWPQDSNAQYVSAGIVNMVQELVKTIVTYFSDEIKGDLSIKPLP
jgi:hypothetical protein